MSANSDSNPITYLIAFLNWILLYVSYALSFARTPVYRNGLQLKVRRPRFNEESKFIAKADQARERRRRYGNLYVSYNGFTPFITIGSYAYVKEFYRQNQPDKADNSFFGFAYDWLVTKMMGALNGQTWKESRRPVAYTYSFAGMQENTPILTKNVDIWIQELIATLKTAGYKLSLDQMKLNRLARGILFSLIYGDLTEEDHEEITEVTRLTGIACTSMAGDLSSRFKFITKTFQTPTVRNSMELWRKWNEFNQRKLRELAGRSDVLLPKMDVDPGYADKTMLFETVHEMTILNVEIVIHVVSHIIFALASHGEYQEEIFKEITEFSKFSIEALSSTEVLPKMRAFVTETARLFPAVNFTFPEVPTKPVNVGGCWIKEGQKVTFDANMINRDPDVWETPDDFKPERFLGPENRANFAKVHKFGFGTRKCLGNVYADFATAFVIDRLVRNFKMRVHESTSLKTQENDAFPMVMNRVNITNVIEFIGRE